MRNLSPKLIAVITLACCSLTYSGCASIAAEKERQAKLAEKKRLEAEAKKIEDIQFVRDHMALMERDLNHRGVSPERFAELKQTSVPPEIAGEYLIAHALYSWQLYLKTSDLDWKELAISCFRQAKEQGGFDDPFCICPKGWTVDTRVMWEKL